MGDMPLRHHALMESIEKYQLLEEAHDIATGKLPIFLHLACDSCLFKKHQQNSLGYIQKEG